MEVMEGGVLPMFFTRDKWDSVRNIVALVQLTVEYLVSLRSALRVCGWETTIVCVCV